MCDAAHAVLCDWYGAPQVGVWLAADDDPTPAGVEADTASAAETAATLFLRGG